MSDTESKISLPDVLERAQEKFLKIAPARIDFVSERSYAMQLLMNNDYLKSAALGNPLSLEAALVNVAAIGLSLNPAKKQAYLIPRSIKQKVGGQEQWITKVFLEPSYMGLCDLATMSGSIKWVQANVVYSNDEYQDNGPGDKPTHKYNAFANLDERGAFIGVYCVAKTADGDFLTATMSAQEIEGIKGRSESAKRNYGPWLTDFTEQAKKTVIRRAFKTWPKTDTLERMAQAVQLSNDNEGFEPILSAPPLGQYTAEQKAYFDTMISHSDAVGMFLFTKSIDETVFINLYHSFEKGTKGKYQSIVDGLVQQGSAKLREYAEALGEHCQSGHDMAAQELLADLHADAVAFITDRLADTETAAYVRQIVKEAA